MIDFLFNSLTLKEFFLIVGAYISVIGIALIAKHTTNDEVKQSKLFWIIFISVIWSIFLLYAWYYGFFEIACAITIPVFIYVLAGIESLMTDNNT